VASGVPGNPENEGSNPVATVHYGLGPIGLRILELAASSDALDARGAMDVDAEKVGRDAGSLIGRPALGLPVVRAVDDLPAEVRALPGTTAFHAAGSRLEKVWPQLRELLDAGFAVVSTCEELAYPWHRYPELSREIDAYAKERGLAVLGTGVNPGFVMDALALCLTAALGDVRRVRVTRAVDVSARRIPLQRKVGVGMDRDDFVRLAEAGEIGHVGLEESARLVAHGLGWALDDVTNTIEPTIATARRDVDLGELRPGDVDGLWQTCVARTLDGRSIELDLTMRVEVEQRDEIVVGGDEQYRLVIPEGLPDDAATAAIAVNCGKRIATMGKGLLTMVEAGLPRHG
jgi:hypothetical protein